MNLESLYKQFLRSTGSEVAAAILAVGEAMIGSRADNLLSVKQAAQQLGISVDTVYEICKDGRMRSRKIGRAVRIHPDDVQDYLRAA